MQTIERCWVLLFLFTIVTVWIGNTRKPRDVQADTIRLYNQQREGAKVKHCLLAHEQGQYPNPSQQQCPILVLPILAQWQAKILTSRPTWLSLTWWTWRPERPKPRCVAGPARRWCQRLAATPAGWAGACAEVVPCPTCNKNRKRPIWRHFDSAKWLSQQ